MQKHLDMTSNDLQKLMTTRTNAINRKLRDVQALEDKTDVSSEELSGIESIEEGE
jgi:DNA recombination protein RmuC